MKIFSLLLLVGSIYSWGTRKKRCADMSTYIQVTEPHLEYILLQLNKECVAPFFADCSGQWIQEVYLQDGPLLGRELAQGIGHAWNS